MSACVCVQTGSVSNSECFVIIRTCSLHKGCLFFTGQNNFVQQKTEVYRCSVYCRFKAMTPSWASVRLVSASLAALKMVSNCSIDYGLYTVYTVYIYIWFQFLINEYRLLLPADMESSPLTQNASCPLAVVFVVCSGTTVLSRCRRHDLKCVIFFFFFCVWQFGGGGGGGNTAWFHRQGLD